MKRRFLIVIAILAFGLLAGCPTEGLPGGVSGGPPVIPPQVLLPLITSDVPDVPQNYRFSAGEPIRITLSTQTEGATLFFLISGEYIFLPTFTPTPGDTIIEDGEEYSVSFYLTLDSVPDNPDRPGYIQLQVVGTKDGYRNSFVAFNSFQIFEPALFGAHTGTASAVSPPGTGYYGGQIKVTIGMTNGRIDYFSAINGYNNTTGDTEDYFDRTVLRAREFFDRMNHWDFDARGGATITASAIRNAAGEAIQQIMNNSTP